MVVTPETDMPIDFKADKIHELAERIISDESMRQSAYELGNEFAGAGGIQSIIDRLSR